MNELAQRMMTLHDKPKVSRSVVFTALLGQMNTLPVSPSRPAFRVGMWPIVWAEQPEIAMGAASLLAFLLEQWREIRVYRLFAQLPDELGEYTWHVSDSQFAPDDWQLEPLDENAAVSGTITAAGQGYRLTLVVENDLSEDETQSSHTFDVTFTTTADLLRQLPAAAREVADWIGAMYPQEILPLYPTDDLIQDSPALDTFLQRLFQWELRLLLWLGGRDWSEEAFVRDFHDLRQSAQDAHVEAAIWGFVKAAARIVVLPGFRTFGEWVRPHIDMTVAHLSDSRLSVPLLAAALYDVGENGKAHDLLDAEIEQHPENVYAWLVEGDLHNQSGRLQDAIDTFQEAILSKLAHRVLYFYYANTIVLAERYNLAVDGLIFADPDAYSGLEALRHEAIQSYREALKLEAGNKHLLYGLLLRQIEVDDEEIWQTFERLLQADTSGDLIRSAVDSMMVLEDFQPAIEALQAVAAAQPHRTDLTLSLAAALVADERYDEAEDILIPLETQANGVQRTEIERLRLIAALPDFEARFAELTARLDARARPTEEEVDFLEEAAERAPRFTAAHLLLARAYRAWNDLAAALEVLLDAQKRLPNDPDILRALAEVLWAMDETETAFEYLRRGLSQHPNHPGLLARTGQYLFETGEEEQARLYLSRAEAIDKRDVLLQEVRTFIATRLDE